MLLILMNFSILKTNLNIQIEALSTIFLSYIRYKIR